MTKQRAPYGTWPSPVTPTLVAGGLRLNDVQWDTDGETLVWSERRGGVGMLVMQRGDDAPRDLTDGALKVGGGVGYGGGDFTVGQGSAYFAARDRLYRVSLTEGVPEPITPRFGGFAAPRLSPDGRWLAAVHTLEDVDRLVLVDPTGSIWPRQLAQGTDFVMQPAWHPLTTHLAYIAWNHPQMPWTGTALRLLSLTVDEQGVPLPRETVTLAGDEHTAIFQPEFSPDGRYLSYVSDATGYGHLYLYDLRDETHTQITTGEAEHGAPAWIQGLRTYGWTHDGQALYYLKNERGSVSLWVYDLATQSHLRLHALDAYTHLERIALAPADHERIALVADAPTVPTRLVSYSEERGLRIHRRATTESLPAADTAPAEAITWTGHDGGTVHGLYAPPTNAAYEGPDGQQPPLIVRIHGGPTSQRYLCYDMETQFFTSRGFAVLQVNYRGSTGYGRDYMNAHRHNWGVHDMEDAASGARYLAEAGLADAARLVIMGGSAGGYTVLQSLVNKPGFYRAGICRYGVSDLFRLALETHKFEARYGDWLVGPLPEAAETYRERSPIFHTDKIQDALLLFQGSDDPVVPQNQSDLIAAALRRRGVPHDYHVYEGEGHGWRRPETIRHYWDSILAFLMQHVIYA